MSATAFLMAAVDGSMVITVLDRITRDLGNQVGLASWIVTGYILGQTIALASLGRLGDRLGHRRVLLYCVLIFTVGSLACAVAPSMVWLAVARGIQGLGGGGFSVSGMGLVAGSYGPRRQRPLSLLTTVYTFGSLVGPLIGGVAVTFSTWRVLFLVNLPLGILLAVALIRMGRGLEPVSPERVEFGRTLLLAVTVLAAATALSTWAPAPNRALTVTIPCCFAGLGAGFLFVRNEQHSASPMFPHRLLSHFDFRVLVVLSFLYGAGPLGFFPFVPLLMQRDYHLGALAVGLLVTLRALSMFPTSFLTAGIIQRFGARPSLIVGAIAIAGGIAMVGWIPVAAIYLWLAGASLIGGVGTGLFAPALNTAMIDVSEADAGLLTGVRGLVTQLGSMLAASALGALLNNAAYGPSQLRLVTALLAGLVMGAAVLGWNVGRPAVGRRPEPAALIP